MNGDKIKEYLGRKVKKTIEVKDSGLKVFL
jgi:hypothetical protein